MISRLFYTHSSHSFFLFGPRGVGKSFFLKKNYPQALYINLLDAETYLQLKPNPSRLKDLIPSNYKSWIIIDEIQKVPELLDLVHLLIEEKKHQFILTGSSARKLKRAGVNLLAGRAYTHFAFPFCALELKDEFNYQKALQTGLLPTAYLGGDSKNYLSAYVKTYLQEEVIQEGLVRNIGGFYRFLEIASFSQGQVLNFSNIASESGLERKTVANYFQLLEDLLLAKTIEVFSHRAKRELVAQRKFYFFDVGVYRQLRPKGPLDSESEINGPAVETLVMQEILACNEYIRLDYKMFFWRTTKHIEVDFILYGERGLYAIEVKSSARWNEKDLEGLLAFKNDYPKVKMYFVYGGTQEIIFKDITIIPLETFLKNLVTYI